MTKTIWLTVISLVLLVMIIVSFDKHLPAYDPIKIYNRNGVINIAPKIWIDTITPNTGNGFNIDISSAGFSSIKTAIISPVKNTASLSNIPSCQIKSISTTAIVCNLIEENSTTVSILGSSVLLGTPLQFVNSTSGLQIAVCVIGQ